jgi:hypothetical protein
MAAKKSATQKEEPRRRGRPPAEVKKVKYQFMLDPRYLKHFQKVAKEKGVNVQDLARWALTALVPDPYNPISGPADLMRELKTRKK